MSFASTEYTVREGQEWVVLQLVRDGDTSRHTTVTVSAAYSPSPEAGMEHVFKLPTFGACCSLPKNEPVRMRTSICGRGQRAFKIGVSSVQTMLEKKGRYGTTQYSVV